MFTNTLNASARTIRRGPRLAVPPVPAANDPDLRSADDTHQQMHPFTLRFENPRLERDYLNAMLRQTMLVVRFGIVLAMVIYLAFGVLDVWIPQDLLPFVWKVRAGVLALATGVLVLSFTQVFRRAREVVMSLFMLLLGFGLLGIFATVPDTVAGQYYVGFLLVIIGSYTVLGLRFPDATLVSLLLIAMYLVSELSFRDPVGPDTLVNATFLLSTLLAAGAGGYISERHRRLAHCRRRTIEQAREESRRDALHDPLTGLPNRRLLADRLNHSLARDERHQTHTAVLFIDVDDFKPINDTHGHVFGDKLLKAIAARLLDRVRLTDTVARLGGDEFVVLLEDLTDAWTAMLLRERILERFQTPFSIDGIAVKVDLSIGLALHPVDADQPRSLLEAADAEMYRIKQQRRGAQNARPST